MTPKQKQKSDAMFKALSGAARRRAEQINHCKKVESKPAECEGYGGMHEGEVKEVESGLFLCEFCAEEWRRVQHENARINARDAELEERRMR